MTELKTLKDLKAGYRTDMERDFVNIGKLRAEAMKWVKSKNTGGFTFKINIYDGQVSSYQKTKNNLNSLDYVNLGAMIELIEFFNLTEEDLK